MTTLARDRAQTLGEEIANAISHGIGCLMAIAALPVIVVSAVRHGQVADVVGAAVFGGTMIVLYLVSTLYHALPARAGKAWFARMDHAAIYLFIAGSYMPFLLGPLRGAWGWSLFGAVWTIATIGMSAKMLNRLRHPHWSTALYVAMGWLALVAASPLVERMSAAGLAWLVAGGVAYTVGAVVFLLDSRMRYVHLLWHVFVMAGSACHFWAAYAYAIV
jgi:hemolysin III